MQILAVGDIHGDLDSVDRAIDQFLPDALVCVGDWGDDGEVDEAKLARIVSRIATLTIFGNHDPLGLLSRTTSLNGHPALLAPGEVRDLAGIRVAGISGIWAKSHRKTFYVTDEDVAEASSRIARQGPVDLFLTHACPLGLADQTPSGTRGGQRCFLLANQVVAPTIHLCGHLHRAQERTLKDGRRVLNVGATPDGSVVVIDRVEGRLRARLARTEGASGGPP